MLNLATVTEALNDTPTARNYFDEVNEILGESSGNAVPDLGHWCFLQNNESDEIRSFCSRQLQTVTVLDHPEQVMTNITDAITSENLQTIYDQLERFKRTLSIICNTQTTGSHWRAMYVNKSKKSIVYFTCDSLGYNSGDEMSVKMAKKLMEVLFHGYGLNTSVPLKIICKEVIVLQRALDALTPFSQLFQDLIVSEINQCINERSTMEWQQHVQESMAVRRSLRRKTQMIRTELQNQLNLTETEIERMRNTMDGSPILVLQVGRGYQAFENLSTDFKKFLADVAVSRRKSAVKFDIEELKTAATDAFDADSRSLLLQTFEEATSLIGEMTYDLMIVSGDVLLQRIGKICKEMDVIRRSIKRTAYSKGWTAISFFGSQNSD